jgi:hypothetical protein
MARVHNNLLIRGLSGKLGDQFVIRQLRDGRTIVCTRPDFSRRILSASQKEHHRRVKAAAAYARPASRENPIYAELAAGTMKNAYNVAFGDWFSPPVIHSLERQGRAIRIAASDDVRVASVEVLVFDEAGKEVERGQAIQGQGDGWEYVPSAAGRVVVEVSDLPGNIVRGEIRE